MLDILTDDQAMSLLFIWVTGCICSIAILASKATWFRWEEPNEDKEGGLLGSIGAFFN